MRTRMSGGVRGGASDGPAYSIKMAAADRVQLKEGIGADAIKGAFASQRDAAALLFETTGAGGKLCNTDISTMKTKSM